MNNNIITPYAIVMEFAGVADSAIAAGGTRTSGTLGQTTMETTTGAAAGARTGGTGGTIVMGVGTTAAATVAMTASKAAETATGLASTMAKTVPVVAIADAAVKAIGVLASSKHSVEFDGGTREMWSLFDRNTRNCHYCTSTIIKNCRTKGSRGFLGLWDSRGVQCESEPPVEECRDIAM